MYNAQFQNFGADVAISASQNKVKKVDKSAICIYLIDAPWYQKWSLTPGQWKVMIEMIRARGFPWEKGHGKKNLVSVFLVLKSDYLPWQRLFSQVVFSILILLHWIDFEIKIMALAGLSIEWTTLKYIEWSHCIVVHCLINCQMYDLHTFVRFFGGSRTK